MSSYSVEFVELDDVVAHPNADALDLAVIGGYRAVVQKGLHQKGDVVLYVPEASVLPDVLLVEWGFAGKLAGSQKNRVKAIRLRGELSQGLVIPAREALLSIAKTSPDLSLVGRSADEQFDWGVGLNAINEETVDEVLARLGTHLPTAGNVMALLGIYKYEPEIPVHLSGLIERRPEWFPKYTDLEPIKKKGYDRLLVEGEDVVITEKLHGTNFGAGMHRDDRAMKVSSRNHVLQFDANNLYWRAALQANIETLLNDILVATGAESAAVFGEVIGHKVQDLGYGFPPGTFEVRLFDAMIDGKYVSFDTFMEIVGAEADLDTPLGENEVLLRTAWPIVPILYRGPYDPAVVAHYTDAVDTGGLDAISRTHVREGVVVKPTKERHETRGGRVILKSVSAGYLLRKNATEFQ